MHGVGSRVGAWEQERVEARNWKAGDQYLRCQNRY